MKKITIKNLTGDVIGVNEIESSKVDEFLNNVKINSPYGKSEYQREVSPREELEDGTIIEAVYETIPAEYTVEIEDITTQYNLEQNKIRLINKGDSFAKSCQNCLSIIGGYNDDRGLTVEQILQMASSFSQIESTLNRRMPKTSKQLISSLVPDGVLVTQELKDLLLDELKGY